MEPHAMGSSCPLQNVMRAINVIVPSLNDPAHWQARATEMRALAAEAKDADTQATMMRLASDYDKLAARAEKRADGQRHS